MKHYTYEVRNRQRQPGQPYRYIGVRTTPHDPYSDVDYWGSGSEKNANIHTHEKFILQIFDTREDAVSHEIMLHDKYDVAVNPDFHNKSKQTTTGFDTTGYKHTEDTKKKMSRDRLEGKHHLRGKKHSAEVLKKMSAVKQGDKNPMFGRSGRNSPSFGTTRKDVSVRNAQINSKTYDLYICNFFGKGKDLFWQRITNMNQWCKDNPEYCTKNLSETARGGKQKTHKGICAREVPQDIVEKAPNSPS